MKKQSGFTLIELVIVIIILDILAATAVPKFIDLQSDARSAAMKGVKGALEGAAALTYSQSAIDGTQAEASSSANDVATVFGYPAATATALSEAAGLAGLDWEIVEATGVAYITEAGQTSGAASSCSVTYTESTGTSNRPSIVVADDC